MTTAGGVGSQSTFPYAVSDDWTFPGIEGLLDAMAGPHPVDNPVTLVLQLQDVLMSIRMHRASVAEALVRDVFSRVSRSHYRLCLLFPGN